MKQLTLFVVFACLVQNKWIDATVPSEVQPNPRFVLRTAAPLDCTQFSHDYEILSSFPFVTHLNPLKPSTSITYGIMDAQENVYYLNIANQIFLPSTVFCLKSLQMLYVRSTSFYESERNGDSVPGLPSEIEQLKASLKILEIHDTALRSLPEEIGRLSLLTRIQLYKTDLIALPDSIGDLSSLQYLYLSYNKLTSLPTTLAKLQSLNIVYLDNNLELRSLQSLNGLPKLFNLQTTNCPIERLPLDLPYLYYLSMTNNNLKDLIGIGTLGNNTGSNKSFYFNNNKIRLVPPQIRHVRNLYRLELDNNELATLPTEIFAVTALHYLYIRNNRFSSSELQAIVAKFNATNPSLNLQWSYLKSLTVKK